VLSGLAPSSDGRSARQRYRHSFPTRRSSDLGHVFIADRYYGFDDGIYTGMRMVEILARENTAALAKIMAEVPKLFTTPQYRPPRSEEHTSELQSRENLVCRLLLEKKNRTTPSYSISPELYLYQPRCPWF